MTLLVQTITLTLVVLACEFIDLQARWSRFILFLIYIIINVADSSFEKGIGKKFYSLA